MSEDNNDWRMHLITHLSEDWNSPWTNQLAPKGSQLTVVSIIKLNKKKQLSIALPNATALCISSSRRAWKKAKKIRDGSKIDKSIKKEVNFNSNTEAFDYIERVMESVVMAFTALEAFVNENIPDTYKYHTKRKSEIILEVMDKNDIERWLSLDEKLSCVLPDAHDISAPKNHRCWSDFKKLKNIRNRVIHMKQEDRRSSGPDVITLWNDIFKIEPPYKQAKEVIDYFVKATDNKPRWHGEYSD
ncbi:MAG: hypothetical protein QNK20_07280 [Aureibaculum sp.]|nr:hypothetical protein [Aureibaculum sp.]